MKKHVVLTNLADPQELKKLKDYITEIFDEFDLLYLDSSPNGSISARRGKEAIVVSGAITYLFINTDGSTAWKGVELNEV